MPKSDSRPRTKSRNGCHTCKRKRLKCDETKPACMNCRKRKIECGGYAVNFKWKSFNETETAATTTSATPHSSGSDHESPIATKNNVELKQHLELVSISVTGKSINEINKENHLISLGLNPNSYKRKQSHETNVIEEEPAPSALSTPVDSNNTKLNSLVEAATSIIDKPGASLPNTPGSASSVFSTSEFASDKTKPTDLSPQYDFGATPSSFSAIVNFAFEDIDALNLIESQTPTSTAVVPAKPTFDLHPINNSLIHTSEEQHLLFLYSEYTCHILSIKNGPRENPWRELILPKAMKYPCLYNSIASMTLFHLSGSTSAQAADMRAKGYSYMKKCVFDLLKGLSNTKPEESTLPADIALVTSLNLAFIDAWYTPTTSGIAHLRGAKSMIERVLKILNMEKQDSDKECDKLVFVDKYEEQLGASQTSGKLYIPKSIQFLFNVWIYLEVLAQMTANLNQDDKGVDLVAAITAMSQPMSKSESAESTPSTDPFTISPLFDNFSSTNYTPEFIDPLLGCGQSLFSIMGKVANLSTKIRKSKSTRNSLITISTASNLKQQLINWKPPITSTDQDFPSHNDSTWDIPQCIATAESYKYATLIYLHHSVPEIPSLSSHKLAQKIFILMASIPEDSNMHVVLIFPLLVASCEAMPGEEREWCIDRWRILFEKMGIGNVERAFDIVKEVWKRKDQDDSEDSKNASENNSAHSSVKENEGEGEDYDQLSGLMAVLNDSESLLQTRGINSRTHWSMVMKEWGWEVLLG
ncbi:uncharacterized protein SPAPADRAFT_136778 [Spathaspora passalidarum NRRL Y-27907]|uniref:Zn(2)-C6 fungal-type domain-containing protein n=1 Tax=Spathaspora passalidarum (strain NRRL Y-27907 / 11-Y1) TaxID=619300 RepID=G3AKK2_SPAPN|nr:uncharacterized protein SPAPADRAFT_136778 [Spathaspora passalidarum NRRL Y-27907]EGW33607.1 hypothetical protein SPAPADRAFT_136778 [Spathaspora passalidarum NRRL Y-27907]